MTQYEIIHMIFIYILVYKDTFKQEKISIC